MMTDASRRRTEQLALEREARAAKTESLREAARKEKLEEERTQRRRQVAKVAHHVPVGPSERRPTEPQPFRLSSATRHEGAANDARRKRAAEEDERRMQAAFKAKPVPKTTYAYVPIAQKSSGPLVEPFSPELQTKHRVVARKVYDEQAEQGREADLAHARALEEQRLADEQEDLYERRRLPVKEGGLMPMAEPVNAVFSNDR